MQITRINSPQIWTSAPQFKVFGYKMAQQAIYQTFPLYDCRPYLSEGRLIRVIRPEQIKISQPAVPEYSPLWTWVGCRFEKTGRINILQLKPEFDSITPKDPNARKTALDAANHEIDQAHPSIEPTACTIEQTFKMINQEGRLNKIGPYLDDLGYKTYKTDDKVFLELPDVKSLSTRWNTLLAKLKVTRPDLKLRPLRIFETNGNISEEDFLVAFLKYDFVLSPSVHDHLIHAMRTIKYILMPSKKGLDYETNRKSEVEVLKKMYERIVNARSLIDAALQQDLSEIRFSCWGPMGIPLKEFPKYLTKLIGALSIIADNLTAEWGEKTNTPFSEDRLKDILWELESPLYFLSKNHPKSQWEKDDYASQRYYEKRFPRDDYRYYKCHDQILEAIKALEEGKIVK